MPQDAFTIRLISRELDETLTGGRINRINQPAREEISLLIYTGKRTVKLTMNANAAECGVYFTEDAQGNPLVAPNFCMLLRKYLSGAEILDVSTPGFERILVLTLRCYSDFSVCERQLVAEIMGKYSNLLLLENGTVLGALKTTSLDENCKRAILPGVKYVPPAPQDKIDPQDKAALSELLSTPPEGELSRFLFTRVKGLAPCTAEQIVASFRGGTFADHVYDYIFSDTISPCVVEQNGVLTDFFARSVPGGIPFPTLSAAQSYYYERKRAERGTQSLKRKLLSAVSAARKKQEKRLSQILEKQRECASAEENRLKGDLIIANLYRLSRGMKSFEAENYERGGTIKIALDERLNPAQNAQNYYKRYRKQKRTLEISEPQEREVRRELDYSESLLAVIQAAEGEADLRSAEEELYAAELLKAPRERSKKKAPEIPYRTYERAGMRIFAGRNNLQNDRLLRESDENDVWFHARQHHSCHVVVKSGGKPLPEEVIGLAAAVCARFSDGGGEKIPVDYTSVKHVKKPPKSKAGFVTYSDFQTTLGDPAALPPSSAEH